MLIFLANHLNYLNINQKKKYSLQSKLNIHNDSN